jgi:Cu/Ag efflux pump CusA
VIFIGTKSFQRWDFYIKTLNGASMTRLSSDEFHRKVRASLITIIFEDDVDIYFARQLVFECLAEAKENVPQDVKIAMGPITTARGEIYQFTLDGKMPEDPQKKKEYLTKLIRLQEWVVNPLLKSTPGVNEVNSFGGYYKHYQVIVAPEKLVKYNLSIEAVFLQSKRTIRMPADILLNIMQINTLSAGSA